MGHYGPPSRAAPAPTKKGGMLSNIGRVVQGHDGSVRMYRQKRHRGRRGYRMPQIVKQQIEHNMRFQDQMIMALLAGAMKH